MILILSLIIGLSAKGQATKKQIYFPADTINVEKSSRMVLIDIEGPFICYALLCNCVAPYLRYPAFGYNKERIEVKIVATRPKVPFIAIPDLLDLIKKHGNSFDDNIRLHIVEPLQGGKFKVIDKIKYFKQQIDTVVN